MRRHLLMTTAAVAGLAAVMIILPSISAAEAPPMGGGYTNVIAIPVKDPQVKAIAGVLFRPEGLGPFPAIIYMSGCAGLDFPPDRATQKAVADHGLAKGFAVLIVDPFTPRGEADGVCASFDMNTGIEYGNQRARDIWAAFDLMAARPDVDARRIFVEGYDYGALSALFAASSAVATARETKPAGVIAYYPHCGFPSFVMPTLIMIGDKDAMDSPALCQAEAGKPNVEVVVFPGATHGFAAPGMDTTSGGARQIHDAKATGDAQARADAFIAAHMK